MADIPMQLEPLPAGSIGTKCFGWWGNLTIIMTEGSLFVYLLFCYYYFAVQYGRDWVPSMPKLELSLPNTFILLLSSFFIWWGERSIKRDRRGRQILGIAIGLILGISFVVIQIFEWAAKPFTFSSSLYASSFFVTTGFHMAHVIVGNLILAALLLWSVLGYFDSKRYAAISIGALYWHFIDLVWLTIFFTYYITPRLG